MNTTAASILGGCIVLAAVIFAVTQGDAPTATIVTTGDGTEETQPSADGTSTAPDLMGASVEARLAKLERELREARAEIARRDAKGQATPGTVPDRSAELPAEQAEQARFFALGKAYADGTASKEEVAELLKMAKDKTLMTRVVAALGARIATNPNDLEARMKLVEVQSARLHSAESITERALLGGSVKEQLEAVLARDETNWDARYTQAVGISHSQRTPQGRANAISAFESLIDIQNGQARQPRFAKTYVELAGVLLQERNGAKARETIQAGLTQYPDDQALRSLLEKLKAQGD
ncbi:MAG: hypothetical protein GY946_22100 [bacterium]|nr:hypothetical protein [bacterium]